MKGALLFYFMGAILCDVKSLNGINMMGNRHSLFDYASLTFKP